MPALINARQIDKAVVSYVNTSDCYRFVRTIGYTILDADHFKKLTAAASKLTSTAFGR